LEQLLAKYFEKVLKMLVYKFEYAFNPKCPLLSLLFQYTHKYNFLHQKLIDVVHQDIDQQQGGGGAGGSTSVSNSFVIYQLHWESKQLRLSQHEAKRLKEQIRIRELSKAIENILYGRRQDQNQPHIALADKKALEHCQTSQELIELANSRRTE